MNDPYDELIIVDVVEHAVVPDAQAPAVAAHELLAAGWARVCGEALNRLNDEALNVPLKLAQIPHRARIPFDSHLEAEESLYLFMGEGGLGVGLALVVCAQKLRVLGAGRWWSGRGFAGGLSHEAPLHSR
jgi:hypothetical protein